MDVCVVDEDTGPWRRFSRLQGRSSSGWSCRLNKRRQRQMLSWMSANDLVKRKRRKRDETITINEAREQITLIDTNGVTK